LKTNEASESSKTGKQVKSINKQKQKRRKEQFQYSLIFQKKQEKIRNCRYAENRTLKARGEKFSPKVS
jgi:hypothetical protein